MFPLSVLSLSLNGANGERYWHSVRGIGWIMCLVIPFTDVERVELADVGLHMRGRLKRYFLDDPEC